MTGNFNNRTPKQRYFFVWNAESVLNLMNSWGSSENLSDNHSAYNVKIIMAFTSALKALTI